MKVISNKTERMKLIEQRYEKNIEEVLRKLFVDDNMSVHDMCKELGISYVICNKWLKLAGIYSRRLDI